MRRFIATGLLFFAAGIGTAQKSSTAHGTADVLMVSDIHFDPFHDPAKFARLRAAKAEEWEGILTAPASPTQAADFDALQHACHMPGVDTPISVLTSSLKAEQAQQPHPLFITVSGDLMAHQFDCRFKKLAPSATEAEYSAFAAKTVTFVALELHKTFPVTPIYFALGNNDSGCGDYRENPNSTFMQTSARAFAGSARTPADRALLLREFPQYGDYNIELPVPHTRLIVMQNLFQSSKYTSCHGEVGDPGTNASRASGDAQLQWLEKQLRAARAAHERVWVMAHIPSGIDAYSTVKSGFTACSEKMPVPFLDSVAVPLLLSQYADVVKLGIFAHTHMDEVRAYDTKLLPPHNVNTHDANTPSAIVPAKLVPAITPLFGNAPAFTVAEVSLDSAIMKDYTVYIASNETGINATWSKEYRYSEAYHLPDFSGASVGKLTEELVADTNGSSSNSRAYQQHYFAGGIAVGGLKAAALALVWPTYACTLENWDTKAYQNCVCNSSKSR